jgi:hypothetical protein
VYEGSFFPTSSPTFVGGGVFDDKYLLFQTETLKSKLSL